MTAPKVKSDTECVICGNECHPLKPVCRKHGPVLFYLVRSNGGWLITKAEHERLVRQGIIPRVGVYTKRQVR